jgi:hypothetical protein
MRRSVLTLRGLVSVVGLFLLITRPQLPRVEAQCESGNTGGCAVTCCSFDSTTVDCSCCSGTASENAMLVLNYDAAQYDDSDFVCPGGTSCTPEGYFGAPFLDTTCCAGINDTCSDNYPCCQPSGNGQFPCPSGGTTCCVPLGFSQAGHCASASDCCTPSGVACVVRSIFGQCCILPGYYDSGVSANCCTGSATNGKCNYAPLGGYCYGDSALCSSPQVCFGGTCCFGLDTSCPGYGCCTGLTCSNGKCVI